MNIGNGKTTNNTTNTPKAVFPFLLLQPERV